MESDIADGCSKVSDGEYGKPRKSFEVFESGRAKVLTSAIRNELVVNVIHTEAAYTLYSSVCMRN